MFAPSFAVPSAAASCTGYHFRLRFREYALLFTLDAIKNPREGDQIAGAANSNTEAVPASPQHLCSISKIERFSFFLLRSFRWFCGKENRSTLEIVEADLLRDRKEMLDDRCRRTFIALVIAWKALASMAGICLDSLAESARALNPIKNLLR